MRATCSWVDESSLWIPASTQCERVSSISLCVWSRPVPYWIGSWRNYYNSKCRFLYLLRNCWSEYPLTNKITWHCFPVSQLTQTCHNLTNLTFTNMHLPQNGRSEDGYKQVMYNSGGPQWLGCVAFDITTPHHQIMLLDFRFPFCLSCP
jgi:hypothetical protein